MEALEPIKFTVIIPTRERCDTLRHTLRTVVEQRYANLSIIVSDNFSVDDTRRVVESFADARIRYLNTGKRLSMSHNWEFALDHVTEGWVTFLGDDDGMLPGALARVAAVIEATRAQAVVSQWRFYYWPGSAIDPNHLMIPCSQGIEVRNSKEWLARVMRGRAGYQDLPYIYTGGFAEIGLVNAARSAEGPFFCSMTPDVYSGIALASSSENYIMLNEPLCVMGVSSHSNGASNLAPKGTTGPAEKFFSEDNIPFHPSLGSARVKSVSLIVYECYLQATHLHHDCLGIALADQVALALASARPGERAHLGAYCAEMLRRHAGGDAALPSPWKLAVLRLALLIRAVALLPQRANVLTLFANEYGVHDVYGAAVLSWHLYRFDKSGRYWRVKKALGFLARCLGFTKR
jgi:hypothetical protein